MSKAKNKNLPLTVKKQYLTKAYSKVIVYANDSIKTKYLNEIAYQNYKVKDSLQFFKINKEALELAINLKDSFYIAEAHWNYALYYRKNEDFENAYYYYKKAYDIYNKLSNTYHVGRMLQSMANIKRIYKDYQGSEVFYFKAIKKYKHIKNNARLYSVYNSLGILERELEEYDKAIFYHNKSFSFYDKMTEKEKHKQRWFGFNSIANTYMRKKEYNKALFFYNKDLKLDLNRENYARILNNRAYCKLLMQDTIGIKKDFFIALKIRDSLQSKSDIISSKKYISDYYLYLKDTATALSYAKDANILAKEIKQGSEYLSTLKQLANLDTKNGKKHLDRYIAFNDSLHIIERKTLNKFTRIEFETDEYIEEAEELTQKNLFITVISIGSILVLSLLFFIRVQKAKNEKLRLEAEQQKANEELYVLTLQQQAKLEEERVQERNRISAELHDGILGKLFGTRVSLGFLGMQMKTDTQQKHQGFLDELQTIEKDIREVSHKLSNNVDDSVVGFTTLVNQLLKDKSLIGNFSYKLIQKNTINWQEYNQETKANIYRIIQETLQNIIKHAKAKNVILEFAITTNHLQVSITDNGIGFNTQKSKKGIGLKNITTRVQKIKGTISLTSIIGTGTTLLIKIPHTNYES